MQQGVDQAGIAHHFGRGQGLAPGHRLDAGLARLLGQHAAQLGGQVQRFDALLPQTMGKPHDLLATQADASGAVDLTAQGLQPGAVDAAAAGQCQHPVQRGGQRPRRFGRHARDDVAHRGHHAAVGG